MIIIDANVFFKRKLLSRGKPVPETDLNKKNQRHAEDKIPVFRLVAKQVHTEDGTRRTTDDGRKKEGFLRNSPQVVLRLVFINTHQCKCQYIDSNQIIVKHYEILLLVSVISLSYSILGKKSK